MVTVGSRNPDFAALAEASYEAADKLIRHVDTCGECAFAMETCKVAGKISKDYHTKRDAALKAIRKAGKK